MPLAAELELPHFDHTDPSLSGRRYREAMAGVHGHDGWLAANPYGFTVLDRKSGEFFLRTKDAVFPGLTIAELRQRRKHLAGDEMKAARPGREADLTLDPDGHSGNRATRIRTRPP